MMSKQSLWCERYLARTINVSINIGLALLCAALTLSTHTEWVRAWLWFCAGVQVGFAIFWLMHEYYQRIERARIRAQMQAEMHAVGAEYVRQMREMYDTAANPQRQASPYH